MTIKPALLIILVLLLLAGCNSKNFTSDNDFAFYVSPLRYEATSCQQLQSALTAIQQALTEQNPAYPIPHLMGERYTLTGDKRLREIRGHQVAILRAIERRQGVSTTDTPEVCPA